MTEHHTLKRLGSTLHYWTTGAKNVPLVIFTHGATLDHKMFAAQLDPLCSAGYRVLTWDMRGHGDSKPMGTSFMLEVATDDLRALLEEQGYQTATFVGHSFGGFVSQEMTYRYPDRVTSLAVIGCTDMAAKPSWSMALASKLMPYLLPRMSLESFRKRTVEHVSIKEEVTRYAYEATGHLSKEEFIDVIMAGVVCLAKDSDYGPQYRIPKPFLLTHGQYDKANNGIFPKSAPAWAQKEPQCTYKVVPQAGHTANQDNPDAFNAILLDFLRHYVSI